MTPLLSLIVPTIPGREYLLEQTIDGLRKAVAADFPDEDVQVIVPENYATIGEAWNAGMEDAEGEYAWLGADDAVVAPGALEAARAAAEQGFWPSPRITNPDGTLHSCGTLGQGALLGECATGTRCHASPFPFFAVKHWDAIGPCLPIHYYADDYLGWRAESALIEPVVVREYEIRHLEGKVGRYAMVRRAMDDKAAFLEAVCVSS